MISRFSAMGAPSAAAAVSEPENSSTQSENSRISYFFHGFPSGKEVISYSAGFRVKYAQPVGKAVKKCLQNRTGYGISMARALGTAYQGGPRRSVAVRTMCEGSSWISSNLTKEL